jgi:hypothetical protein
VTAAYVPWPHELHCDCPGGLVDPTLHARQAVIPVVGAYEPLAHELQTERPKLDPNVPIGQKIQEEVPVEG